MIGQNRFLQRQEIVVHPVNIIVAGRLSKFSIHRCDTSGIFVMVAICSRLAIPIGSRAWPEVIGTPSSSKTRWNTVAGIKAGCNAGTWTVGITRTGNLIGLSESDFMELPEAEQQKRLADAAQTMFDAGADFVLESVQEIPDLIQKINHQLNEGMLPGHADPIMHA